jgi:metal-responsive CopG/Arc/MetJ family transcriptional regulator
MAKVNVSLPDELLLAVDTLAEELGRSRSGLVQEATARYVAAMAEERADEQRKRGIAAAMADARDLAGSVRPGADTTSVIRRDRDSDHANAYADE